MILRTNENWTRFISHWINHHFALFYIMPQNRTTPRNDKEPQGAEWNDPPLITFDMKLLEVFLSESTSSWKQVEPQVWRGTGCYDWVGPSDWHRLASAERAWQWTHWIRCSHGMRCQINPNINPNKAWTNEKWTCVTWMDINRQAWHSIFQLQALAKMNH